MKPRHRLHCRYIGGRLAWRVGEFGTWYFECCYAVQVAASEDAVLAITAPNQRG